MSSSSVTSCVVVACMSAICENGKSKDFSGVSKHNNCEVGVKSKKKMRWGLVNDGFRSVYGSRSGGHLGCWSKYGGSDQQGGIRTTAVPQVMEGTSEKKPPTKERRVVVTGMGVVTPNGHDPDVFYENLLQGVSGISEIESFDCSHCDFSRRLPKILSRPSFQGFIWIMGQIFCSSQTKCVTAKVLLDLQVINDAVETLNVSYKKMNPFCVPLAMINMGSAMLAMDLGWMGPTYSISTACATSNFCIFANHIIKGDADVMLSGGSEATIMPLALGGFIACRALSQRNSDPTGASRPWDSNRDGFVMGEGAGVLLLEELEHAKRRSANIYAEFLGGSFTCDAYHMTDPHSEGAGVVLCIQRALAQAGVSKEDVNYINAHATSTPAGDLKEYQALVRCFGQNPELRVNSTKSMIGHLLAIRTGWVHPNLNLENPDVGVDMSIIVGSKKERLDIKVALSNSFGFGGHNSAILFAPYK
ncbi:unnamed protein product [Withania somnifera]